MALFLMRSLGTPGYFRSAMRRVPSPPWQSTTSGFWSVTESPATLTCSKIFGSVWSNFETMAMFMTVLPRVVFLWFVVMKKGFVSMF